MSALPPYADTPIGRELIAQIIAQPPEGRPIRDDWGTRDHRSFAGKLAGQLRRMHKEWAEREYDKLNRQFAITGIWDDVASQAICGAPDGNQLIELVLAEAEAARLAA